MKTIVTFGEVMGRLDFPDLKKIPQALPGSLNFSFGGAESNVAASLSYMGKPTQFVSVLPQNPLGEECRRFIRGQGVGTDWLSLGPGRLGLYFVESGANQRPSRVVYDREYSAISQAASGQFDWEQIMEQAAWFHVTGITPSLSEQAAKHCLDALKMAEKKGVQVSCDLNFRKKLWNWKPGVSAKALAQEVMSGLLPYVDLLIGNEEDAADVLGIHAGHSDVEQGELQLQHYPDVARQIVERFPRIQRVAITLRESFSASHNNWGAMLYLKEENKAFFAPQRQGQYSPYEIKTIVDRVGGGDAFAAGLIYALNTADLQEDQQAIDYAVAASCLCHSIRGDVNYSSGEEVMLLMKGNASGRVQR